MPKYTEPVTWTFALMLLFFMDVSSSAGSLCVFRFLGINDCPGCGLGHAVYYALHFDFMRSFEQHVMGPIVTMAILIQIFKSFFKQTKVEKT